MKLKLIDVETNSHYTETGSCDLCMSIEWVDEPTYVFETEEDETIRVDAYSWDWGHYDQEMVDNVIAFADFVSQKDFTEEEVDELRNGRITDLIYEYDGWSYDY